MSEKRRGLGRGLDDLLSSSEWLKGSDIQLFYCPLDRLHPNPYQPRHKIHPDQLEHLAHSIRRQGVLQPILVTRAPEPEHFQIIAGERRWQAAKLAGLAQVPVILREATSPEVLELALIENIQRKELNCLEEAAAYQRLQDEFGIIQEEIARRVGKKRSTVANLMRLLQLPTDIQDDVLHERLAMGHARALLSLADPDAQRRIRDAILARDLSVRQAEQVIARLRRRKPHDPKALTPAIPPGRYHELEKNLSTRLAAPVTIRTRGKGGTITFRFASQEQLEELLKRIGVPP